jgi:hypothetical protein
MDGKVNTNPGLRKHFLKIFLRGGATIPVGRDSVEPQLDLSHFSLQHSAFSI